ncbi:MAG TPA: hypothetical protein VME70_07530 [Mycobacteriales bacterium]|nr:hypothetical protein [Mycobacteriales bacterium]
MSTYAPAQETRPEPTDDQGRQVVDGRPWPRLVWSAVGRSSGSCCCPGKPAYQAVLRPRADRSAPVEIVLCAHHYRRSRSELDRIGGAIYDCSGRAVALPAA